MPAAPRTWPSLDPISPRLPTQLQDILRHIHCLGPGGQQLLALIRQVALLPICAMQQLQRVVSQEQLPVLALGFGGSPTSSEDTDMFIPSPPVGNAAPPLLQEEGTEPGGVNLAPDAPEGVPEALPGATGWRRLRVPRPHPQYKQHASAQGDANVAKGQRLRVCKALLFAWELKHRPCCKKGTQTLLSPLPHDGQELLQLYDEQSAHYKHPRHCRSMNIRFTFSAMRATGGGGEGGGTSWGFVDNNTDMGYMRICGPIIHSMPLHKKIHHINWTYTLTTPVCVTKLREKVA